LYKPIAWIITIGNELLVGRIVDTNAAWLASRLTFLGASVRRIVTVGDTVDDIVAVLRDALASSDIVVTTGGLGPTDDDITMEAVAAALNLPLVLNREALEHVSRFYSTKPAELTRERLKMALLPLGAKPIPNPVGAAPGAHVSVGRSELFVLPGVPREMKPMFDSYVADKLKPILPELCVREKSVVVKGVAEADLAPLLRRASRECVSCYVKSHPKGHEAESPLVDVRVLASAPTCEEADAMAQRVIGRLMELVGGGGGGGASSSVR